MSNVKQMSSGMQDWEKVLAEVPEEKREECLVSLLLGEASMVDEEELARLRHNGFEQMLAELPEEERKELIDKICEDRKRLNGYDYGHMAKHCSTMTAALMARTTL